MAYRLKQSESLTQGVRRVFGEEIAWAVGQLTGSKKRVEAVHEARKSIKKIRGLLSLLGGRLGPLEKQEDRYFRQAARALSDFRDSDVILETFEDLVRRHPEEDEEVLAEVRVRLQPRGGRVADAKVKSELAKHLEAVRSRVDDWPLENLTFEELLPAIEKSYRKGRRALARAKELEEAEAFHELRKSAKEHWYHLRLFESEGLKQRLEALHGIESALGDEHNLTILRDRLEAEAETIRDRQQVRRLLHWTKESAKSLREQALADAEKIYAEKPEKYGEGLKRLWTPPIPKQPPSPVLRAKSAVA